MSRSGVRGVPIAIHRPSAGEVRGVVLFIVALMVLVAVGVLLWKAVGAQALATGSGTAEDDAPTGPTRPPFGGGRTRHSRPVAPDDDPEFLRSLDDRMRRPDRDDPPSS